jgi:hypothetical protein
MWVSERRAQVWGSAGVAAAARERRVRAAARPAAAAWARKARRGRGAWRRGIGKRKEKTRPGAGGVT